MAPVLYRPQPLPPSLLTELATVSLGNRFAACVALTAGIWGHGLAACSTDEERVEWMDRLVEYLTTARNAWASTRDTYFTTSPITPAAVVPDLR